MEFPQSRRGGGEPSIDEVSIVGKKEKFFLPSVKPQMRISQKHFSGRLAPFKFKFLEYFLK